MATAKQLAEREARRKAMRLKMKKYYASDTYKNRTRTDFSKTAYDTATASQKKTYNAKPKTQATFKISEPAKTGVREGLSGISNTQNKTTQFDRAYQKGGIQQVAKRKPKYDTPVKTVNGKQVVSASDAMKGNIDRLGTRPTQSQFTDDEGNINWRGYAQSLAQFENTVRRTQEENIDIAKNTTRKKDDLPTISEIESDAGITQKEDRIKTTKEFEDELREDFFSGDTVSDMETQKTRAEKKIQARIEEQKRINTKRVADAKEAMQAQQGALTVSTGGGGRITNLGLANAYREGKQEEIDELIRTGDLAISELEDSLLEIQEDFDINTRNAFNSYVQSVRKEYTERKEDERKQAIEKKKEARLDAEEERKVEREERLAEKHLDDIFYKALKDGDGSIPSGALQEMALDAGIDFDVDEYLKVQTSSDMLDKIAGDVKLAKSWASIPEETRKAVLNGMDESQKKIEMLALHEAIIEDVLAKESANLKKKQGESDIRVSEAQRKENIKNTEGISKGYSGSGSSGMANIKDIVSVGLLGKDGYGDIPLTPSEFKNAYLSTYSKNEKHEYTNMYTQAYLQKKGVSEEIVEEVTQAKPVNNSPKSTDEYGFGLTPVPKGEHETGPDEWTSAMDKLNNRLNKSTDNTEEKEDNDFDNWLNS